MIYLNWAQLQTQHQVKLRMKRIKRLHSWKHRIKGQTTVYCTQPETQEQSLVDFIHKSIQLIYQSTMSLLAQQLNKLKQNNAISIAPGAPKASLILDKQTARNTTVDVLYTMALMGYTQIKKQMFHSGRSLGQQLLSEEYKEINRNRMSKQENKALSIKITRFLLIISPLFLNRGCQAVLEYLLRNFSIHVFESEQLALIFLQYWQHEVYRKLIQNIQIKTTNLQFLKGIQQNKQINLTYIIKSLTYSRSLLDSLIMFTRKYIKEENSEWEEIEIQLVSKPTVVGIKVELSTIVKHDLKQFLLQVLCTILNRNITTFNKQISQFCIFASKQNNELDYSMAMLLSISLLAVDKSHPEWINRVLANLLSKSIQINKNIFNFVIVLWQRWPTIISNQVISMLLEKQHFVLHLTEFERSLHMPFYMLFQYFLQPNLQNKGIVMQLLNSLCLKVKQEQFVNAHENSYYGQIFNLVHQNYEKLQKNEQKTLHKLITSYLKYEYAVYVSQNKIAPIADIFQPQEISKSGRINFMNISKAKQQRKSSHSQQLITSNHQIQSQQQQEQYRENEQNKQNITLMKVINSHLKKPISAFDIANKEIRNTVDKLIKDYYNSTPKSDKLMLTTQQKNRLFENSQLFAEYSADQFYYDFQKGDYNTAIKYLMKEGGMEMCYKVLLKTSTDAEAINDLLYRELARQAIDKLAELAESHYKSVINIVGKLYHQFGKNTQTQLMRPINEMMLRISSAILGRVGKQKGKYYKLIAEHSKYLALLVLSQAHRQAYALETYIKLINIFGAQNTYCLFISAAELLATKQKDKKGFGNFIDKVLIPSLKLNNESEAETELAQYKSILKLLQAVNKCLIFCFYMLQESKDKQTGNEQQQNQADKNEQGLESGVAKKMIIHFFGLTTAKSRRAVVRKIFLFMSSLFKSPKLSALFRQVLSTINRKQQLKISSIASKIYSLLVTINNETVGPLNQATTVFKANLLKLFPLQLKVDVLGPLLPLNQVYNQLGNDLEEHSTRKFDNLNYFINIVPFQVSDQWSKFSTQCIKRGYFPTEQNVKQILQLSEESSDKTNLVKFICVMTEFAKQECLNILDLMMQIILNQCKQPNDYALAILFTIVKNLKQFVDPYLDQIFKIGIQVKDGHVKKFIDGIVESFTASTLVSLAKTHSKTVENAENFSYFLNKISSKVTFESIWKTTQIFFSRSLNNLIQDEKSFMNLHQQQSEVFVAQAMKMNEDQLRKILIEYVRWSSDRTNVDEAARLHFNARKNLLLLIFQKLSQKLGDLFTHFFGYLFQDLVKDIKSLTIMGQIQNKLQIVQQKNQKRSRMMSEYAFQCLIQYTKQLLSCLKSLFEHDPGNQFMDSIKFDTLAPQLATMFNFTKFDQHYSSMMKNYLGPCLISLFKNTKDDYKLKTINTEILRLLRTKDQRITNAIFGFYDNVADQIDYRFLLFTDQMIPLLIEASSSRNKDVKKSVESIIYKIQNLSGQKIDKIGK